MRDFTARWLALPAALIALLAAGCDPGAEPGLRIPGRERTIRIVALFDTLQGPQRSHQRFLLERLTPRRAGATLKVMDALGNSELQLEQAERARSGKYDFILVFPLDATAVAPILAQAKAEGARVIAFADGLPPESVTSAIVCSERDLGRFAGGFVVQSLAQRAAEQPGMAKGGRIVQLTADPPTARAMSELSAGFAEALTPETGAVLVHDAPCGPTGEHAVTRIADALRLQEKFDVVFAHNDLVADAAAKALVGARPEARENVLIVGVGGDLELVARGEIDATIYNPPLVDLAWVMILRFADDSAFVPKPRYARVPQSIVLGQALELSRTGHPMPTLE